MPVRAPAALGEQRVWGWPLFPGLQQVLTGMPGYQSTPEPQTQAGASGPTAALHGTTGLTAKQAGRRAQEAYGVITVGVITCPVSWAEYFCRT